MSPVSPGPITRTVRQALILELLEQNLVSSQMQLSELLKNKGVEITQGTLSRDLDELGPKKFGRTAAAHSMPSATPKKPLPPPPLAPGKTTKNAG